VKFDPARCTYEDLCTHFYTFHDPTTVNRQGNDSGTQYASVVFVHDGGALNPKP
jgi:peptide-methionine (S)-S-oxide reductase